MNPLPIDGGESPVSHAPGCRSAQLEVKSRPPTSGSLMAQRKLPLAQTKVESNGAFQQVCVYVCMCIYIDIYMSVFQKQVCQLEFNLYPLLTPCITTMVLPASGATRRGRTRGRCRVECRVLRCSKFPVLREQFDGAGSFLNGGPSC